MVGALAPVRAQSGNVRTTHGTISWGGYTEVPTRNARNGMLFTTQGIINIGSKKWADDFSPIDAELGGHVSTFYSKAYLRHLIHSKEILGAQIASQHNLTFYLWLVKEARKQIVAGTFSSWKPGMVEKLMRRL